MYDMLYIARFSHLIFAICKRLLLKYTRFKGMQGFSAYVTRHIFVIRRSAKRVIFKTCISSH